MNLLSAGQRWITLAGLMIEVLAAIVVAYHVLQALIAIVRRQGSDAARLWIGEGVIAALGFSMAGTLLKTIGLQSWTQIRLFAFVFLLRTLLKRVFQWEQRGIRKRLNSY